MIGPSQIRRTSAVSAKGERVPAWPPAPAATRISPSTPASSAFSAWRRFVTSWKTTPPQSCTARTTASGARSEVMMTGTRWRAQTSRSCSRRSLEAWTIWLTA
jgi:hypothetical protein